MCIDLSKLNCFVLREQYQSLTPAEAVADIKTANEAKYFKVIDATKGYQQYLLAEDSRHLLHCLDDLNTYIRNYWPTIIPIGRNIYKLLECRTQTVDILWSDREP